MRGLRRAALCLCLAALTTLAGVARAEINSATGRIAGVAGTLANGDGSGEAQIEITSLTLPLVKQARDLTGAVLVAGSAVTAGQEIYFVLHVDNTTAFPAIDVRITDLLDESQFTYVPGSLEQTTVASGSSNAAIWAGVWTALSDGTADDDASATDTGGPAGADRITVGAVPAQTNQTVNVAGPSLRAFRFRVTVN